MENGDLRSFREIARGLLQQAWCAKGRTLRQRLYTPPQGRGTLGIQKFVTDSAGVSVLSVECREAVPVADYSPAAGIGIDGPGLIPAQSPLKARVRVSGAEPSHLGLFQLAGIHPWCPASVSFHAAVDLVTAYESRRIGAVEAGGTSTASAPLLWGSGDRRAE